jgi:long-chain fatty acid transport protein
LRRLPWLATVRAEVRVPKTVTAVLFGIVLTATPGMIRAQAFLQWDLAARPAALGGAATAMPDDPSTVFYNPAGMAHLSGTFVQVGGSLGADASRFRGFGTKEFDRESSPTIGGSLYISHTVAEKVTGGIAINTPWILAVEWEDPSAFVGRFQSFDADLRSINFNPVVAAGPYSGWSLAIGVDVLNARFDVRRFEQDPDISALAGLAPIDLARSRIDADGTGIGWNGAVMFVPSEQLIFGAQVRSEIEIDLNGVADFVVLAPTELRAVPIGEGTVGDLLDERLVSQNARIPFTFPSMAVGGVAFQPIPELWVRADLQWVNWSAVDAIQFQFDDPALDGPIGLDYDDAWSARLGAEVEYLPGATFRIGYAWEETPADVTSVNPLVPDATRNSYSIGLGLHRSQFDLDFGYRFSLLDDREGVAFPENDSTIDGVYETVEHWFGAAITRRL